MTENVLWKVSDAFVLRDICGIRFVVDIRNKRLYREKRLTAVNLTGWTLLHLVQQSGMCTVNSLTKDFLSLLEGKPDANQVFTDVQAFVWQMQKKGILEECAMR